MEMLWMKVEIRLTAKAQRLLSGLQWNRRRPGIGVSTTIPHMIWARTWEPALVLLRGIEVFARDGLRNVGIVDVVSRLTDFSVDGLGIATDSLCSNCSG